MTKKTVAAMAITIFSCFGLLTLPMDADAGRFRGGNMGASQARNINAGQQGAGMGFVDANGDGINDNFVDADGDGICDLTGLPVGSRGIGAGAGLGRGMGPGGPGNGVGFIDANGDGINDNFVDLNGDGICDLRQ